MGGFSSGSNPLLSFGAQAIDSYLRVPVASSALAVFDAQAGARAEEDAVQADYDRQSELLRRQQDSELRHRRDLLRRSAASQRARLGAMGIGGSGSAAALLEGLQADGARQISDIQQDFADRQSQLDYQAQTKRYQSKVRAQQKLFSGGMPGGGSHGPGGGGGSTIL